MDGRGTANRFDVYKMQRIFRHVDPHPSCGVLVGWHVDFHGLDSGLIARPALKLQKPDNRLNGSTYRIL
jgi:hypothetical protein